VQPARAAADEAVVIDALTRDACEALDIADPLAAWRRRFALPAGVIYVDGNSLGPLPKATAAIVQDVVRR
jgi:kynureninase